MRSNQLVVHPDLPPREKHPPDWTKPPEGAAAAGPTTALPGDPAGMVGEAPVVAGARGATAPGRKAGVR
jgi:hypothetical protein